MISSVWNWIKTKCVYFFYGNVKSELTTKINETTEILKDDVKKSLLESIIQNKPKEFVDKLRDKNNEIPKKMQDDLMMSMIRASQMYVNPMNDDVGIPSNSKESTLTNGYWKKTFDLVLNQMKIRQSVKEDSGALIVKGGVGSIKSDEHVITNNTTFGTSVGAIVIDGGVAPVGHLHIGGGSGALIVNGVVGNIKSDGYTVTTSTGCITIHGVLGLAKSYYVGCYNYVGGDSGALVTKGGSDDQKIVDMNLFKCDVNKLRIDGVGIPYCKDCNKQSRNPMNRNWKKTFDLVLNQIKFRQFIKDNKEREENNNDLKEICRILYIDNLHHSQCIIMNDKKRKDVHRIQPYQKRHQKCSFNYVKQNRPKNYRLKMDCKWNQHC